MQSQAKEAIEQVGAKSKQLHQYEDIVKDLERNENETRRHVKSMTGQIDERDYKIDKLENQIMEH